MIRKLSNRPVINRQKTAAIISRKIEMGHFYRPPNELADRTQPLARVKGRLEKDARSESRYEKGRHGPILLERRRGSAQGVKNSYRRRAQMCLDVLTCCLYKARSLVDSPRQMVTRSSKLTDFPMRFNPNTFVLQLEAHPRPPCLQPKKPI